MNFQIWGPSAIVKRSIFVMCIHFRVLCPYVSHYSRGRVLVTKAVLLASMLDDTYNAYATFEELQRLIDAFERWEMNDKDQLSDYLKVVFNSVHTLFDEFDKEMDPERWPHTACYARETGLLDEAMGFFDRVRKSGFVPGDVTYNSLLQVFGKAGMWSEAVKIMREMEDGGVKPDSFTYNGIVGAYVRAGFLEEGVRLLIR
ncbi:hypothetical protein Droror1_Dr00026538 [Drosera rotundifolia]